MLYNHPYNKKLMKISFAIYLVLLVWVIIFKCTKYEVVIASVNKWRQFDIPARWQRGISVGIFHNWQQLDFLLNALIFLPLGLLYSQIFKHQEFVLVFALLLSTTFEVSQFFSCIGMLNIYDILANTLGTIVGFIIYLCLRKLYSPKFINIMNSIIIPPASTIAIYAIYMTIANFNVYV